jgi:hypothetical protein
MKQQIVKSCYNHKKQATQQEHSETGELKSTLFQIILKYCNIKHHLWSLKLESYYGLLFYSLSLLVIKSTSVYTHKW